MKKFKVYLQHDSMECGMTCLRMICKHYGAEYSSEYLSRLCFATNEGVSLLGMSDAAERLGCIQCAEGLDWSNYATCRYPAYCTGTKTTSLCCTE